MRPKNLFKALLLIAVLVGVAAAAALSWYRSVTARSFEKSISGARSGES